MQVSKKAFASDSLENEGNGNAMPVFDLIHDSAQSPK